VSFRRISLWDEARSEALWVERVGAGGEVSEVNVSTFCAKLSILFCGAMFGAASRSSTAGTPGAKLAQTSPSVRNEWAADAR
jgi:hypothetical protein